MKLRHKTNVLFVISACIYSSSIFSQTGIDSLRKITQSPSFTLVEDYAGDWGGYSHTFIFTKKDTSIEILWQDPEFPDGEEPRELKMIFLPSELKTVEVLFGDCIEKIRNTKDKSTEHSKYIFKNKQLTYIIDDKFTMKCVDNFKAWKEKLFKEGIMQEKRNKKK